MENKKIVDLVTWDKEIVEKSIPESVLIELCVVAGVLRLTFYSDGIYSVHWDEMPRYIYLVREEKVPELVEVINAFISQNCFLPDYKPRKMSEYCSYFRLVRVDDENFAVYSQYLNPIEQILDYKFTKYDLQQEPN